MKKVINTRTNVEYEVVGNTDVGVSLKEMGSGKEKVITHEVYNKWYRVVGEEPATEAEPVEQPKEEEVEQPTEVEETENVEEKPKKKVRVKKEKAPKEPKQISVLKDVLEKILKAAGCEIFITQVKGFHTVKVGGKMAMAYTFSTKGIVLWMRSKAIETLNIETKVMKHMFDRRLSIQENTEENVELIRKIVAVSVDYQKQVNEMKQAKVEARIEYLKEKEAKREAKKQKDMEAKFGIKQKKNKKSKEESVSEDVATEPAEVQAEEQGE